MPPVFTPCVDDVTEPVAYQPASRPSEFAMSGNESDDRGFPFEVDGSKPYRGEGSRLHGSMKVSAHLRCSPEQTLEH